MEQLISTFITTGICNVVVLTSFEFCCLEGFNIIVSIVWGRKCFRVDFNAINIHIFRAANTCFAGRNIIMPSKVNINPLLISVAQNKRKNN